MMNINNKWFHNRNGYELPGKFAIGSKNAVAKRTIRRHKKRARRLLDKLSNHWN